MILGTNVNNGSLSNSKYHLTHLNFDTTMKKAKYFPLEPECDPKYTLLIMCALLDVKYYRVDRDK